MDDLVGTDVGRYHILEKIGAGGMATVYKAVDTSLGRDVAIKIIRLSAFPPDQLVQILKRFEREAQTLAKLSHSNIVKVYDFGDYEGSPYLVLEYLPGGTLKQRLLQLKGKPMPWDEAIRLLRPITDALEFAHSKGMVHRDVKPSNILLTNTGETMLSDFGIAKLFGTEDTAALTSSGMGMGTPEYMAPEQWSGKALPQSDQYSLGVVLYEMVTGRKPYEGDTPASILLKQATQPLPRPRKFSSSLPAGLEEVILKALASKPEDRFESIQDFSLALKDIENTKKMKKGAEKKAAASADAEDGSTVDALAPEKTTRKKPPRVQEIRQEEKRGKRDRREERQLAYPYQRKNSPAIAILTTLVVLFGLIIVGMVAAFLGFIPGVVLPTPRPAALPPTATVAPIVFTQTPEPTLVSPTDTPLPTITTAPTSTTRPVVKRKVITTENINSLSVLDHISGINQVNQVKWYTDNKYLITSSAVGIMIYETATFTPVGSFNPPVPDVYFSEDGTLVAYFETTRSLKILNVEDQSTVTTLPIPAHNGLITSVAFSQDKDHTYIAIGSSIGEINVYKIADGSLVSTLKAPNTYVNRMIFSPNGTDLFTGSGSSKLTDYLVREWNISAASIDHVARGHKSPVTYLFVYPDGSMMASGSNDGGIYIYTTPGLEPQKPFIQILRVNFNGTIQSMAFSADGTILAYAIPYNDKNAIVLVQTSDGSELRRIPGLPEAVTNLSFSVDNTALAAVNSSQIQIWEIP